MCIAIIHSKTERMTDWMEKNLKPEYWQRAKGGIIVPQDTIEKVTAKLHTEGLDNDYSVILDPAKEYIVRLSPNATVKVRACCPEYARVLAWKDIQNGFPYGWHELDFLKNAEVMEAAK